MTIPTPSAWVPPENPDVSRIYDEIALDRRAKRFEDALAKTLWFHECALDHAPDMRGVRLSFALAEWTNLAESYPPALTAMRAMRDRAEERVAQGGEVLPHLRDASALNRELEEPQRDVVLFKSIAARFPDQARECFAVLYPSLLDAREYALCDQYMDADRLFKTHADLYRTVLDQHDLPPEAQGMVSEMARTRFTADACTVVALLAIHGKSADAKRIPTSLSQHCNTHSQAKYRHCGRRQRCANR
jgi:hypothetical protein